MKKYPKIINALKIFNPDYEMTFEEYRSSFISWYEHPLMKEERKKLKQEIIEAIEDRDWDWKIASDSVNCYFSLGKIDNKLVLLNFKRHVWDILFPEKIIETSMLTYFITKISEFCEKSSNPISVNKILYMINDGSYSKELDWFDFFNILERSGIFSYILIYPPEVGDIYIQFQNDSFLK